MTKSIGKLKIVGLQSKVVDKDSDKIIVDGVDLEVSAGELHVIMGPNGSGKSTLCYSVMGHPAFEVSGRMSVGEVEFSELDSDKRAKLGLFLGFQHPREVAGVTFGNFLRLAVNNLKKAENPDFKPVGVAEYYKVALKNLEKMGLNKQFIGRHLNQGFSGGEKKRAEIVQMLAMEPKFAFLDEIDSGLDVDGLKLVAEGIREAIDQFGTGVVLITHNAKILEFLKVDFVHVMMNGKIVRSGGMAVAEEILKGGYAGILNK